MKITIELDIDFDSLAERVCDEICGQTDLPYDAEVSTDSGTINLNATQVAALLKETLPAFISEDVMSGRFVDNISEYIANKFEI